MKFVTYERMAGRPSMDDQWLQDVGVRINAAADLILAKLREAR